MIEVIVAPQARADLLDILRYLATVASPATADRWDRKFWAAIHDLAEFPGIGAPRPALGANVRIKIVGPYVIIYEHARGDSAAHVLRVVHGKRNITRKLLLGR